MMRWKRSFTIMLLSMAAMVRANAVHIESDTIPDLTLKGVEIVTQRVLLPVHRLSNVHGNILVAGKKNEVIELSKSNADLASVNQRQIFARVPGLMIWESDGSGVQIGIAARGLSPNRSWEFNTRQNGYDITPDVFGYPEAYYTPPMEAVERIEFMRGAASLQFGPQFGGMVNYVLKNGHGEKSLFYEGRQSMGSFGMLSSFNAIGGTKGRWSYYTFAQQRKGNGWRENGAFDCETLHGSVEFRPNERIVLGLNVTRSDVESQQPGGLTDNQYSSNWRSSSRSRNWLHVPWNVASVFAKVRTSNHSMLDVKLFGVLAQRSSVGFMKAITVLDTINAETNNYNTRKLDIDAYQTWGAELRWLLEYSLWGKEHQLAAGVRYSDAHTHRQNDGTGTTGTGSDMGLASGSFGKNLFFDNVNSAAFVENIFHIGNRLTVTPALRMENLLSRSKGYIAAANGDFEPLENRREFLLAGLGIQYEWKNVNMYANASQAYRPVTFSDFTPASTTDLIDPKLKDGSGYNAELGIRGTRSGWLNFDAGVFYLLYDNRIGVVQRDNVNFRTNIGSSVSKGVEIFVEVDPIKVFNTQPKFGSVCLFVSGTLLDARYVRWDNPVLEADPATAILNRRVEYAPKQIWRSGANYKVEGFTASLQWSFVGQVFSDALNTVLPSSNAQAGLIEQYNLFDLSLKYEFTKQIFLQSSCNNLLDTRYATRRAGGYPGPGLLPGTGRNITITLGLNV